MGRASATLLAATGAIAASGNGYTAVWSIWSNCDCSGPAKAEHTVPICAPRSINTESVAISCAADGQSVTVHSFDGDDCAPGNATRRTSATYPVGECLPNTFKYGHRMSRFDCVKRHAPRAKSIVGAQYADTTCGADKPAVIAATNYVSGCFASCKPPPHGVQLANLWQVADPITGLTGSLCNGTNTTCTPPYAPEGQVAVGECQVLGRATGHAATSVKYSYWDGPEHT